MRAAEGADDEEQVLRQRIAGLTGELEGKLAYCSLERELDAAKADEGRLAGRLADAVAALAAARELCPLRAALAEAAAKGYELDQRRGQIARDLGNAIDECRKKEQAAARKAEEDRRKAEAERRQAEAERRKAEQAQRKAEAAARAAAAAPPPAPPPEQPPQQQAAAPPPKPTTPPGLPPCPGERTPEEAPDAAIVLDASGSMRLPASASLSQIQGMLSQLGPLGALGALIVGQAAGGGGPSRLEAAKRGVNSVVRSMPDDVDVGLVTLQRCPMATNEGFFSGAERGRLYARVDALTPMQGTPLAQGILQAGEMVDGVKAPAVMVVISDGDDSCGGNPCAAAERLKAEKPLLKINVVDILGNGAGSCVATATGGRVLKPGDGLAFEKTIKEAAQDAIKPAHCR